MGIPVNITGGTLNSIQSIAGWTWDAYKTDNAQGAQKLKDAADALLTQHGKDVTAWSEQQKEWRTQWAIAQAAFAAAQMYLADQALEAAKDAAKKQYDIADRQQTIAESEYNRYSEHFAQCENKTVDAERFRPEYEEDIEAQCARAEVDVKSIFARKRAEIKRRRQPYCIGAFLAADRELDIEEARQIAMARERTRRYLEERQEARRDKYFNRKLQLFNVGRGIKADAVGEMRVAAAGYAQGSDVELAARNQFYGAILSSLGGVMGAFLPNNQTQMPFSQGMRAGSAIGGPLGGFSGVASGFAGTSNVGMTSLTGTAGPTGIMVGPLGGGF